MKKKKMKKVGQKMKKAGQEDKEINENYKRRKKIKEDEK